MLLPRDVIRYSAEVSRHYRVVWADQADDQGGRRRHRPAPC